MSPVLEFHFFRFDDKYDLTLAYNDGMEKSNLSSGKFSNSIGNYFDENVVLCYDRLTNDLQKIYDQARLDTRKVK